MSDSEIEKRTELTLTQKMLVGVLALQVVLILSSFIIMGKIQDAYLASLVAASNARDASSTADTIEGKFDGDAVRCKPY